MLGLIRYAVLCGAVFELLLCARVRRGSQIRAAPRMVSQVLRAETTVNALRKGNCDAAI
jgi:hypothetical protein